MNTKFIITGGPGTGKTSIINELKKRGYNCVEENSREVISEQIKTRGKILPWKNQLEFENKITFLRAQQFLSIPKNCLCFFDRSVIESVAYLKLSNLKVTSQIMENIKKCVYNKTVFYTPIWEEIYVNDSERKENLEQAKKIESALIETYRSAKYNLIQVPKTTIQKRVNFIISKI